jgi:hypothetical protein
MDARGLGGQVAELVGDRRVLRVAAMTSSWISAVTAYFSRISRPSW